MDYFQSHPNLHTAALAGDDDGVYRAIQNGADVNALDISGRTALMCAVAGEHWQNLDASDASFMNPKRLNTIRLILNHPSITLFTLNAPQNSTNGVIPLGMAAWLNMEEAVRLLLEASADAVSVDGMDTHGATALMYAARDGGLGVAQLLLSHGARPDFRDRNHRSSMQYSLEHPQILWLCESVLRRHRWRESQSADRNKLFFPGAEELLDLACTAMPSDSIEPPPLSIFKTQALSRSTDALILSITSSDLSFLQSLLFAPAIPSSSPSTLYPMSAPVLVNRPDFLGWSPIHYCVSVPLPCIDVLDALYCAGAEVALFTTHEHFTPLHILAKSALVSSDEPEEAESLYHFALHLIRDLRAPLSARDKNDETCIHIAAEHGHSIELLTLFLEFDSMGSVRDLRNSRGLTALDVARPEFRVAFGENVEKYRSVSSLSTPTIRGIRSFSSLVSLSDWTPSASSDDASSLCSPLDLDLQESVQQLLINLRSTSHWVDNDPDSIERLTNIIRESSQLNSNITSQFQRRVQEAGRALDDLRQNAGKTHALLDWVTAVAVEKLGERGFDIYRRRNRGSEDSQTTVLNRSSRNTSTSSIAKTTHIDDTHVSVATQTILFSSPPQSPGRSPSSWAERFDGLIARSHADSSAYTMCISNLAEVERDLASHRQKMAAADADWNEFASPGMDTKLKQLMKKHKKLERELEAAEKKMEKASTSTYATSKLKAWLKRIITHDRPAPKLEIVYDLDQDCSVGRQVKSFEDLTECLVDDDDDMMCDARIDSALRTANVILNGSRRDLRSIDECLEAAEGFLNLASQSITRAERVVQRAIKKRQAVLASLRAPPANDRVQDPSFERGLGSPGLLGYGLLSAKPSVSSLLSVYSSHSSCASIAPTVTENDDDDTRAIRRLLMRKIEAGVTGSWDEMDKVQGWLSIVKEAVRGVKRRAYL